MMTALIFTALIHLGNIRDGIGSEKFQVVVHTGYTEAGLPYEVVNSLSLSGGKIEYSRETSHGHTLVCQFNTVTKIRKMALEGGSEILISKDKPTVDNFSTDRSWMKPHKTKVQRIANFDCYHYRSGDVETWVSTSNPNDIIAIIIYDHGKVSESSLYIEKRKRLPSDVRLFELPAKARTKWVTKKQMDAFYNKYIDISPPAGTW